MAVFVQLQPGTFAERAETVQNLNNFFGSAIGQDPQVRVHISGIKTAKLFEDLLEVEDYELINHIRITEQADAQRLMNSISSR